MALVCFGSRDCRNYGCAFIFWKIIRIFKKPFKYLFDARVGQADLLF